jgi:hypothetical protein
MPYAKSEMREQAERRMAGAQARLAAAMDDPAAVADGSATMAGAMRSGDHATARAEANRLAPLHPEIGEAWKALDEAAKFLAFTIMSDVTDAGPDED